MKIILVGGGKVGTALARQLSEEGHSVTVIDTSKARVEQIVQAYDNYEKAQERRSSRKERHDNQRRR